MFSFDIWFLLPAPCYSSLRGFIISLFLYFLSPTFVWLIQQKKEEPFVLSVHPELELWSLT